MRRLPTTCTPHWTISSTFTIQKIQDAKSSQFSHRQHYHDYKNIAWNLDTLQRILAVKKKQTIKMGNKFLHNSFIESLDANTANRAQYKIHPSQINYSSFYFSIPSRSNPWQERFIHFIKNTRRVTALHTLIHTDCLLTPSGREPSAHSFSKAEISLSWKASQVRTGTRFPELTSDAAS